LTQAKVKIKAGAVEIEFEGTESFLKKEMPELLDTIMVLYRESKSPVEADEQIDNTVQNNSVINSNKKITGTTATVASKLGGKTAPQLLIAACAQLTFVESKTEFSRNDILTKMKSASGYYKESMGKNLSATLQTRVGAGDLMEIREGTFSLNAELRSELEKKLA